MSAPNLDWQDDLTSMPDNDGLSHDMAFMACLGAGLMAIVPIAFCFAVARAKGWL